MQNAITVDLTQFTPMELANIELAANSKKMSIEEYIIFLLQGVATPTEA